MTHFEKITREEIARRNYSEGTTRAYLRALHELAGYFQRSPERLTPEQIRQCKAWADQFRANPLGFRATKINTHTRLWHSDGPLYHSP